MSMAMIDWIDRRLHNWARHHEGSLIGGLGYATVNLQAVGGSSGQCEVVIPTNQIEAEETEVAVRKLPRELQRTVELYYRRTASRKELASLLGCSLPTVDSRLSRAHRLLADMFNEEEAAQARIRAELRDTSLAALEARQQAEQRARAAVDGLRQAARKKQF